MIPGELYINKDYLKLNINRKRITVTVANYSNKIIQIGSHFHFYEVNQALYFNRKITLGCRLDIPSGTTIIFKPGEIKNVSLIHYTGKCKVYGFNKAIMGKLKI